jgi:hypothetical protein
LLGIELWVGGGTNDGGPPRFGRGVRNDEDVDETGRRGGCTWGIGFGRGRPQLPLARCAELRAGKDGAERSKWPVCSVRDSSGAIE